MWLAQSSSPPQNLKLITLCVYVEDWEDNPTRNKKLFQDSRVEMAEVDTALCRLVDLSVLREAGQGHTNSTSRLAVVIRPSCSYESSYSDEAKDLFLNAFPQLCEQGALTVM